MSPNEIARHVCIGMLQIKKREEKQNVDQNTCLCVLHNKLLQIEVV